MKKQIIITLLLTFFSISLFADIQKANNLIENQDYISAVNELKTIIAKNPKDYSAMDILLSTYIKMGRKRSYIVALDNFLAQNYSASNTTLKTAVVESLAAKDYPRMLKFTRILNTQDRNNAENLNYMGLALYYLRDYKFATGAFLFALSLESNNYIYMSNLARNYVALGDKPKARLYYKKSLAINPNFERSQLELQKLTVIPVIKEEKIKSEVQPRVDTTLNLNEEEQVPLVVDEKIEPLNMEKQTVENEKEI